MGTTYLDRAIGWIAPRLQLKRQRARIALDMLQRHYYDAASTSRRTQGWPRGTSDPNAPHAGASLSRLRELARDLERNNPYAVGGILDTIETDAVGWGIVPTEEHAAFKAWSESTACDADGRSNLAGLTKTVMRTIPRDGEILVRRRWRAASDGLPLPFQVQLLEADYLDTAKEGALEGGGRIVQGVEFDALGRRVAYWLFREHPGSTSVRRSFASGSHRVPATEILHCFKPGRAGQVRGASWFSSVNGKFRDYDEFDDATLMTQKVASCLSIVSIDVDGASPSVGAVSPTDPTTEKLGPGMVLHGAPGRDIKVVQPPRVGDFGPYSATQLRAIGKPFGVTYEAMTGDFSNVNFSSARMGRLGYQGKLDDWRDRILIQQFLNGVWAWAMEAAAVMGLPVVPTTDWTAPALPMLEPDKEGSAARNNIRAGVSTISETIRERGYNPKRFLRELADDFEQLDKLGLILDCDPRKVTQQGMLQTQLDGAGKPQPPKEPASPGDAGEDAEDDEPKPKAPADEDEEDDQEQEDDGEEGEA